VRVCWIGGKATKVYPQVVGWVFSSVHFPSAQVRSLATLSDTLSRCSRWQGEARRSSVTSSSRGLPPRTSTTSAPSATRSVPPRPLGTPPPARYPPGCITLGTPPPGPPSHRLLYTSRVCAELLPAGVSSALNPKPSTRSPKHGPVIPLHPEAESR